MNEDDPKHAWLPHLLRLADYDNDWTEYVAAVYGRFRAEVLGGSLRFQGLPVRCRRDPIAQGKEAGFWHCVSEGRMEDERTPDLRRCERIPWIRAIIENVHNPSVQIWSNANRGDRRTSIWFNEEYLIVLGHRKGYWQLITAFPTNRDHTVRKLRTERDDSV